MTSGPKKVLSFTTYKNNVAHSIEAASKLDETSSHRTKPPALSDDDLRVFAARVANGHGTVRETWHSRFEREYRHISMQDILHGLRAAWVCTAKDWDDEHRSWEYLLQTVDIDGDELALKITANTEAERIEVLTKY